MSETALSLLPATSQSLEQIEIVLSELNATEQASKIRYALMVADARLKLRELMTDGVVNALFSLLSDSGDKTGMQCDKLETYRDLGRLRNLMIAAFIEGLYPVGNEINLLGGNVYATKEAYERKLREAGVAYTLQIGADETKPGEPARAYFACKVQFVYRGKSGALSWTQGSDGDFRIVTRRYSKDTPDTLRGKAESKALRQLYKHCVGRLVLESADFVGVDVESEASVDQPPRIDREDSEAFAALRESIADCHSQADCEGCKKRILLDPGIDPNETKHLLDLLAVKQRRLQERGMA